MLGDTSNSNICQKAYSKSICLTLNSLLKYLEAFCILFCSRNMPALLHTIISLGITTYQLCANCPFVGHLLENLIAHVRLIAKLRMAENPQKERTFIMIKPDGVQRGLIGEIVKRFEQKGFTLRAMKFQQVKEHTTWSYSQSFYKHYNSCTVH